MGAKDCEEAVELAVVFFKMYRALYKIKVESTRRLRILLRKLKTLSKCWSGAEKGFGARGLLAGF